MSVAGGLHHAFEAGVRVGCDCLQIFVRNQRQWRAPPLTDEQVAAFEAAKRETGLDPVVAHASYLLNPASPDRAMRKKSIHGMIDELTRCEALGISALIFHPGSHVDDTMEAGIKRISRSLDEVHGQCPGYRTIILLETTAGQGTAIGHRFEQLAAILDRVREPDRLGVCLDTCHLFAAGYDFRTAAKYGAMIDELDSAIGLSHVRCIHVNDSKRGLGSRVDRHEHIGKGRIGKRGFAHFLNDERFASVPMILETPKGKDGRGTDLDKVNLKRLRRLMG
jgi:deoxyribonuclease-4